MDLPEEVVLLILKYIPASQLIVNITRVCKKLCSFVENNHHIWTDLIFDECYTITSHILRIIVNNDQLKDLTLAYQIIAMKERVFNNMIFSLSPCLRTLNLAQTPLREMSFVKKFYNLTTLDVSGTQIDNRQLMFLSTVCHLKHLYISFTNITAENIVKCLQNFTCLEILDACEIFFTFSEIVLLATQCKNLAYLHVSFTTHVEERHALLFLDELPNAKMVELAVFSLKQ